MIPPDGRSVTIINAITTKSAPVRIDLYERSPGTLIAKSPLAAEELRARAAIRSIDASWIASTRVVSRGRSSLA